jgi:hypothetical protein
MSPESSCFMSVEAVEIRSFQSNYGSGGSYLRRHQVQTVHGSRGSHRGCDMDLMEAAEF